VVRAVHQSDTIVVGSPIVAEFDDDANESVAQDLSPNGPPTQEASVATKRFWLRAIEKFTEPVDGEPNRRTARMSRERDRNPIRITSGAHRAGESPELLQRPESHWGFEIDTTDDYFLILYHQKAINIDGKVQNVRTAITIPWVDLKGFQAEVESEQQA
jgi:hypothetical protein